MSCDKVIIFRVPNQDRLLFLDAAQGEGIGLSEWIRRSCKQQAEKQGAGPGPHKEGGALKPNA